MWTWCWSAGRPNARRSAGLLARAAEGYSGALVLRGETGVGKTALLDETVAAAAAAGMQTARLTGVEAETQLGYAGLHRFLLPFADQLERLPGPQRDALRSTFGLVAGPPADRFLVALAVLTLLADVASAGAAGVRGRRRAVAGSRIGGGAGLCGPPPVRRAGRAAVRRP